MTNKKETVEEAVEEIVEEEVEEEESFPQGLSEITEEEIEEEEEAQIDGDASGPIIVEDKVIEADTNSDPRRWYVKIWNRLEPQAKDTYVEQLVYSELEGTIETEVLADPRFGSSITAMQRNALIVETDSGIVGLTASENPEEWIRNVHLADTIIGTLYATEARAEYETYET